MGNNFLKLSYCLKIRETIITKCTDSTIKTSDGVMVDFIYKIKPANDFGKNKIKIENMKYKNINIKAK